MRFELNLNISMCIKLFEILNILKQFKDEEFSWTSYLKSTNSESAPNSCFCQHVIPPVNEFKVANKLETIDPRNTTSVCIGENF